MVYFYVYKVHDVKTGEYYYGSRKSKVIPEKDIKYKGSMKIWKPDKNKLVKEIIKIFDNYNDCILFESNIIKENIKNDLNRNYQIPSQRFARYNKITVKDKDGNTFSVSKDDPKYLKGELAGVTKGTVSVKDKDGNTFRVPKDDPRYLNDELVGVAKGKIPVKDKDGNTFSVSKDDPKYLNGEFVAVTKNNANVIDEKGKRISISKDDPRYLKGELKHFSTGKVLVKDKKDNKYWIDNNDPRYLNGELIHNSIGKKASEETKKKMSCAKKGRPSKMKGRKFSKEAVANMTKARKDRTWINNGIKSKIVKNSELDEYFKTNWEKGRIFEDKRYSVIA